jgi:SulP family sulfate permease
MVDALPQPGPTRPGVVVLDVGDLRHVASTALKQLDQYEAKLSRSGGALVLAGVDPAAHAVLAKTGLLERIGEENVLPPDPHLGGALQAGRFRGQALLAELRAARADDS